MLPRESSVTTRVQSVPTPPPAPVSSLSHKEDQFIFQKSTEIAEVLTKTTSGKPTHKWAKPSKSSVKTSKGSHGPGTREAAGGQGMDHSSSPLATRTSTQALAAFPCPRVPSGMAPPPTVQNHSSEVVLPPEHPGHQTGGHFLSRLPLGRRRASHRLRPGLPFHAPLGEFSINFTKHFQITRESPCCVGTCVHTFPLTETSRTRHSGCPHHGALVVWQCRQPVWYLLAVWTLVPQAWKLTPTLGWRAGAGRWGPEQTPGVSRGSGQLDPSRPALGWEGLHWPALLPDHEPCAPAPGCDPSKKDIGTRV